MKKTDADPPCKRRRLISPMGSSVLSSVASVAVIQLPSNVGGSLADDKGTPANPISLDDSTDDSNGGANISMVNNNKEIVSFRYCYLVACIWMYDDLYTGRLSYF